MNIADRLILFRETQNEKVLGISGNSFNIEDLNVISIEVLSWLKPEQKRVLWMRQGRKNKLKPLHLNMQYSWCRTLSTPVKSSAVFSDVFENKDNELCFRESIPDAYRSESRSVAFEKYAPQRIL